MTTNDSSNKWAWLKGTIAMLFIAVNTLIACVPLYVMGFVRFFTPKSAKPSFARQMDRVIDYWVGCNRWLIRRLQLCEINVHWETPISTNREQWYVISSNHQTWTDILLLQTSFRYLVAPLKFFTKQELIWIPGLGLAMWFLGFPYVRRASAEQLAKRPDLKDRDKQATLRACDGFKTHPTCVLNFLEGTRFTEAKHARNEPKYQHLLNPKIGGLSYVVQGLNEHLAGLLDVTIHYPNGVPSFTDFLQGRCQTADLYVQALALPESMRRAPDVEQLRADLVPWVEEMWQNKDNLLKRLHAKSTKASTIEIATKETDTKKNESQKDADSLDVSGPL